MPWESTNRRPPLAPDGGGLIDPAGGWRSVEIVAETGSTNADLSARAAAGEPEGLVLIADQQTAGRGRLGRDWVTPPGAALAISVLLRPAVPGHRLGWLPLLAGVALVDALADTTGLDVGLKWPNDVLVRSNRPGSGPPVERKVSGILAEAAHHAVILGVGVNLSQGTADLPVPTATSLRLAGSTVIDRDVIAAAYLRALARRYQDYLAVAADPHLSGLGDSYRERCVTLGRVVDVRLPGDVTVHGVAESIDDDGQLVVRVAGEPGRDAVRRSFAAGDVEHLRAAQV